MAQPVSIKGKEGATLMPMEAIAMAIMNNAMKGDLAAAKFIRQLTGTSRDPQLDEAKARERLLAVVAELRTALEADGLKPADGSPELELLAVEFSTAQAHRRPAHGRGSHGHRGDRHQAGTELDQPHVQRPRQALLAAHARLPPAAHSGEDHAAHVNELIKEL